MVQGKDIMLDGTFPAGVLDQLLHQIFSEDLFYKMRVANIACSNMGMAMHEIVLTNMQVPKGLDFSHMPWYKTDYFDLDRLDQNGFRVINKGHYAY